MTRKGNKVVILNFNDKDLKDKLKAKIDKIYLDKGYQYKNEVIEKDILDWFYNFKGILKHKHHITRRSEIFAYGFEMSKELHQKLTANYSKGIVQKIILNWFENN